MTITLHWWYLPIALLLGAVVYSALRKPQGDWDLGFDLFVVWVGCIVGALGITLGHYF